MGPPFAGARARKGATEGDGWHSVKVVVCIIQGVCGFKDLARNRIEDLSLRFFVWFATHEDFVASAIDDVKKKAPLAPLLRVGHPPHRKEFIALQLWCRSLYVL